MVLAALLAACTGRQGGGTSGGSVGTGRPLRGGVLRVADTADVDSLDTGVARSPLAWAVMRAYARQLYAFDSAARGDRAAVPVPDLADGEPAVSPDGRTWVFHLRAGARFAPPVGREVTAGDFVAAIARERAAPGGPANPYLGLLREVRAPDRRTLRLVLARPVPELRSILALPLFAPVPAEYAARFRLGDGARAVGLGPYTPVAWQPGHLLVLARNPAWDPAADPLRHAFVDRIEIRAGLGQAAIEQALERGTADLNLDGAAPRGSDLPRIVADGALAGRWALKTTGCERQLELDSGSGPTARLEVRRAVAYAVDKHALLRALGGPYAGLPAPALLPPSTAGGGSLPDRYATDGDNGDVDRARGLLRQAGLAGAPARGGTAVTLRAVTTAVGDAPAALAALGSSLERAGIRLRPRLAPGPDGAANSLDQAGAQGDHELTLARLCPDWPGDAAWSLLARFDGRRPGAAGPADPTQYVSPEVDRLIDEALAQAGPAARARRWAAVAARVSDDAAAVPLTIEEAGYLWSARLRGWAWSPWVAGADLTAVWLCDAACR